MKKIVVVTSYLGRSGTSMTMGLLQQGGINVGSTFRDYVGNPKGVFELEQDTVLMRKIFPKWSTKFSLPPTDLGVVDRQAKANIAEFYKFLTIFGGSYPIAFKGIRYTILSFLRYLPKDSYIVKVINLDRPIEKRVDSVHRLLQERKRKVPNFDYKVHIEAWKSFGDSTVQHYGRFFPIKTFMFDDILEDPISNAKKIFRFIGETIPKDEVILNWVDPALANGNRKI